MFQVCRNVLCWRLPLATSLDTRESRDQPVWQLHLGVKLKKGWLRGNVGLAFSGDNGDRV